MKNIFINLLIAITLFLSLPVEACTLWAANGSVVENGGTLIVKNRDWEPNQHQVIKFVPVNDGYSYFGLYAEGATAGMKAGINEKGLVVLSATAGSVPSKERKAMPNKAAIRTLLKECGSVDEALMRTDLFVGPKILMFADSKKVATVEIGPDERFSVEVKENGCIYHTNHYVLEDMLDLNKKIGVSSQKRYDRIGQLLIEGKSPYTFDEFLAFSSDQNDGPDNSISRIGSTPAKTRTMAIWAVKIPFSGSPEVYVRILNPNEDEKTVKIVADDFFSMQALLNKM